MLIIIFSAIATVLGIVLIIIGDRFNFFFYFIPDILTALGGACLVASTFIAFVIQISKEDEYQSTFYEKKMLEYRLSEEENVMNNDFLYASIVEFNSKIARNKRYSDSPWIGLYFNDKIAAIEYIEIDFGDLK